MCDPCVNYAKRNEKNEKRTIERIYDPVLGYNFRKKGANTFLMREWFRAATDFEEFCGVKFAYVVNDHEQVFKVFETGMLERLC